MGSTPGVRLFWCLCIIWMVTVQAGISSRPAKANDLFDSYGVADGLAQSSVLAMAEDAQGLLWFGTQSGISLYDGYAFTDLDGLDDEHRHLSASTIYALHGGRADEMWIATARGISRVEWPSKQVTSLWHHHVDPITHPGGFGEAKFLETCHGDMVVTRASGVFLIEHTSEGLEQTLWLRSEHPGEVLWRRSIFSMVKDRAGTLWVADAHRLWRSTCDHPGLELVAERGSSRDGDVPYTELMVDEQGWLFWSSDQVVSVVNPESAEILDTVQIADQLGENVALVGMAGDGTGGIWSLSQAGIHQWHWSLDRPTGDRWQVHQFWDASQSAEPVKSAQKGLSLVKSGDGLLWALSAQGLMMMGLAEDPGSQPNNLSGQVRFFPGLRFTAPSTLYRDRFGVVWFSAGLQGLRKYSPERNRFGKIQDANPRHQSVRGMAALEVEDSQYLWAGWDQGGLSLLKKSSLDDYETLADFDHAELSSKETPWGTVRAMVRDSRGQVWLANAKSLWRANTLSQQVEHVHTFSDLSRSEQNNWYENIGLVYDSRHDVLFYSHSEQVWRISLNANGAIGDVDLLDWIDFAPAMGVYLSLIQLQDGRLLLGSNGGLVLVDLETRTTSYQRLGGLSDVDPRDVVISLAQDDNGWVWVGTRNGLGRFRVIEDEMRLEPMGWWQTTNGLPDNIIYAIGVSDTSDVWVSTNRGLAQVHVEPGSGAEADIRRFGISDGLPFYEFNSRAITSDSAGRLFFGGVNGIAWFDPEEIQPHPMAPDVVLSQLNVNDEPVELESSKPSLELSHEDNSLAIAYAGIHFSAKNKNQYSYQLEGHDPTWVQAGQERTARYTNLEPGNYRFWLRSANLDGIWSEPRLLFQARIAPPPWATPMAYALYVLLLMLAVAALAWSVVERRRRLEALIAERTAELGEKSQLVEAQAKELAEALEARTLFFANISHEFRTPLTLIQTAIEQLDPNNAHPKASQLAKRYVNRLTRLVDQLLDLSRLRLSGVEEANEPWSLTQIIRVTLEGFDYLAKEQDIDLVLEVDGEFRTLVDQASVEKILLNLLTNAFKYTPRGGSIVVTARALGSNIQLAIQDTGPGIAPDQHDLIFQRFERVPSEETLMREGAGIGLALVKEAATAIGGSVELESVLGQGATFRLNIPGWMLSPAESSNSEPSKSDYLSGQRLRLDQALLTQADHGDQTTQHDAASHEDEPTQAVLVVRTMPI